MSIKHEEMKSFFPFLVMTTNKYASNSQFAWKDIFLRKYELVTLTYPNESQVKVLFSLQ